MRLVATGRGADENPRQGFDVDRLAQDPVGLDCAHPAGDVVDVPRGDHHGENRRLIAFDALEKVETVHLPAQAEIEQRAVRTFAHNRRNGRTDRGCATDNLVAARAANLFDNNAITASSSTIATFIIIAPNP